MLSPTTDEDGDCVIFNYGLLKYGLRKNEVMVAIVIKCTNPSANTYDLNHKGPSFWSSSNDDYG